MGVYHFMFGLLDVPAEYFFTAQSNGLDFQLGSVRGLGAVCERIVPRAVIDNRRQGLRPDGVYFTIWEKQGHRFLF